MLEELIRAIVKSIERQDGAFENVDDIYMALKEWLDTNGK